MCNNWLEVGEDRIPVTRKELKSLAGCIRSHCDLSGLAADILDSLDDLDEPIPTNDTLVRLAAIASEVQRCPVPESGVDGIAEAMQDIGAELAGVATDWYDDINFSYAVVIRGRERLRYWGSLLRGNGDDQYADDVDHLMDRIRRILLELR